MVISSHLNMKTNSSPPWYSSYEQNNYGNFFYTLMRVYQPETVVELGTKAGYSTYHIARGLRDNGKGKLDCYDLWEKYQFNSVPLSQTQANLKEFNKIISFNQRDAIGMDESYKSIDILHVDLSNDGILLEQVIPNWIHKTNQLIIMEGGSDERDKIEWMVKNNKLPIKTWLEDFSRRTNIKYLTIEPFPSVTLIHKE